MDASLGPGKPPESLRLGLLSSTGCDDDNTRRIGLLSSSHPVDDSKELLHKEPIRPKCSEQVPAAASTCISVIVSIIVTRNETRALPFFSVTCIYRERDFFFFFF